MENNNALTVRENPAELMRQSTDVAGVCREIVKNTATNIGNKKYVCVEGWQAIATAHGCVAGAEEPQSVDGGVQAEGYVRRISDGTKLSTGHGFVGDDEATWAKRPMYAKRAMAQTRAISRACRSAFSHVVVLIDSELSTTPAEEVPKEGFNDAKQADVKPIKTTTPKQPTNRVITAQQPKAAPNNVMDMTVRGEWSTHELGFGKYNGQTLGEVANEDPGYMDWLANKRTPKPMESGDLWESDIILNKHLDEWKAEIIGGLQTVKDVVESVEVEKPQDDDVPF